MSCRAAPTAACRNRVIPRKCVIRLGTALGSVGTGWPSPCARPASTPTSTSRPGVLREVGAGLSRSAPTPSRSCTGWGSPRRSAPSASSPTRWTPATGRTGALLGRVPLADAAVARWGAPFYHLHRADLHDALRAALGDRHITLGARCVAVEQARHGHGPLRRRARGDRRPADRRRRHPLGGPRVRRGPGPADLVAPGRLARPGTAAVGHEVGLEVRQHSFWGPRKQFVATTSRRAGSSTGSASRRATTTGARSPGRRAATATRRWRSSRGGIPRCGR